MIHHFALKRGIDDERVMLGLERATELLIELADAQVSKGIISVVSKTLEQKQIHIEKDYFSKSLGVMLDEKDLLSYFDLYNLQS